MLRQRDIPGRQRRVLFLQWLLLLLATGLLWACNEQPPAVPVDLGKRVPTAELQAQPDSWQGITLGIGSMITPKEGFIYYQRLVEYLESRLDTPFRMIDKGTYEEFNKLLENGSMDIAFVCSGAYVMGKDSFNLELLVVPETLSAETVYYSYLIVPQTSDARSMADLKGKHFAYTDPGSNSGKLSPDFLITRLGEDPARFFSDTTYTYAHDRSIAAVAEEVVDGAAVDSLIYDYMTHTAPETTARTRIIARSEPYGIPPVVIRPGLHESLREQLKSELLDMHENPLGASILQGMMIKRFVAGRDSDYGTINRMRDRLNQAPMTD